VIPILLPEDSPCGWNRGLHLGHWFGVKKINKCCNMKQYDMLIFADIVESLNEADLQTHSFIYLHFCENI
jgi:hypothetical protein